MVRASRSHARHNHKCRDPDTMRHAGHLRHDNWARAVTVPAGGQLKVPTPRVDQVLFRVVPPLALAWRMR